MHQQFGDRCMHVDAAQHFIVRPRCAALWAGEPSDAALIGVWFSERRQSENISAAPRAITAFPYHAEQCLKGHTERVGRRLVGQYLLERRQILGLLEA